MNPEMSKSDHGRVETRFTAGLPCVLHSEDGDFECRALDLSRSGVLIAGDFPVPCEDQVEVTLRSQAGDVELRLASRTTRSREDYEAEHSQVALAFEKITEERESILEALVARIKEGVVPTALQELPGNASPQAIREALNTVPDHAAHPPRRPRRKP